MIPQKIREYTGWEMNAAPRLLLHPCSPAVRLHRDWEAALYRF